MSKKKQMSEAELAIRLCMLAKTNRAAYREIRAFLWVAVVENSSRSDFPSEMS